MADMCGVGIVRTESGRETYTAAGLSGSEFPPHWPLADETVAQDGRQSQSQRTSLSGTTRGASQRSSQSTLGRLGEGIILDSGREQQLGNEQALKQEDLSQKTSHHDSNKRDIQAASNFSGAGGEKSDADVDIEKQNLRNQQRFHEKDEEKDLTLVEWDGPDDPGNPQNFKPWRKWLIAVITGIMTFTVTFASSVFSTATDATAEEFNVSSEVMVLGTALFVLGFAFGPIVWGPLSELYGRKWPLFTGFFIFAIFQIPVAVAHNLQTIFVCRFFGGFFASAPLAVVGGLLTDLFDPVDRALAIAVFSGATSSGPVAGPIVGGFVTMSYLGWRWTAYLTAIMAFAFGLLGFLIIPETFAPTLLQARAKNIRQKTKNWAVHSKLDEHEVDLKEIANTYLLRPFIMLALEPILLLLTLYMGFIYGFLYLCFEAYPIAFQEGRGWNLGVGALPFLGILVGVVVGCATVALFTKTRFARKLKENDGEPVPEERLVPMMIGGFLVPIGMFWFAWTSNSHISWVPQVVSGVFLGAGILLIFLQGMNYIIDCYGSKANSAIAANTFFRSWLGAGFPLFATGMFHKLGVPWAMSLLGFLSTALLPVPILFFFYGPNIRKLSKYSPTQCSGV